ncbi:MAG: hypothetical protein GEU82_12565 [Luteitalea sp.]|nr:hypothetical protein [Luteitalea sp.]
MDVEKREASSSERVVADIWNAGIQIDSCARHETFIVQTQNSVYEIITLGNHGEVMIRGGRSFPELTQAWLIGALSGGPLRPCGIYVGSRMQVHAGQRTVVTSKVLSITESNRAVDPLENSQPIGLPQPAVQKNEIDT